MGTPSSASKAGPSGSTFQLVKGGKTLADQLYKHWKAVYNRINDLNTQISALQAKLHKNGEAKTRLCRFGDNCRYLDQGKRKICKYRHEPNLTEQINCLQRQMPYDKDTIAAFATRCYISDIYKGMKHCHKLNNPNKLTNIELYVSFGNYAMYPPNNYLYKPISLMDSDERGKLSARVADNVVFFFRSRGFTVDPPNKEEYNSGKVWLYS